eukprot:300210_1
MTKYDSLLLCITAIGIVQLVLILLFWFLHLKKYRNNPIYKIRSPRFWISSVLTSAIVFVLRAIITYLRINSYISQNAFSVITALIVIMMGFSFDFGRVLFLWYSLKLQRFQQDSFIQTHLCSVKQSKTPFFYRNANFFGNPRKAFSALQCLMLLLFIMYTLTLLVADKPETAKDLVLFSVILLFIPVIILVLQLWCCNKSSVTNITKGDEIIEYNTTFRDDFRFRLEITLFLSMFLIILPGVGIIEQKYEFNSGHTDANAIYGMVLWNALESISNTLSIFIQIFVPYLTFKQNVSQFSNTESKQNVSVSLFDVLSHKVGFFLFIDQLVQELSFENLSFLIEVYQLKKITADMIKRKERKKKKKQKKIQNNTGDKNTESKENEPSEHSQTEEFSATFPSTSPTMISGFSDLSQKIDGGNFEYFANMLCKLPWLGLPLTDSIINAKDLNKMKQAENIYDKYIDQMSYYAVNVSGNVFDSIQIRMNQLKLWKSVHVDKQIKQNKIGYDMTSVAISAQNTTERNVTPPVKNKENEVINLEMNIEMYEIGDIKNEDEWNDAMLKVFDSALPDIFRNLQDSMVRFRKMEQFLLLSGHVENNK